MVLLCEVWSIGRAILATSAHIVTASPIGRVRWVRFPGSFVFFSFVEDHLIESSESPFTA
jgi:hypothetical protein